MISEFSKRLKELRIENNLTQKELAESVNKYLKDNFDTNIKISRVSINRYENNARIPNFDVLLCLSDVLNTDVDFLLGKNKYKHAKLPNNFLNDLDETFKNYIERDDEELNNIISDILDGICLIMHNREKQEFKLVHKLLNLTTTSFLEISNNRNVQYIKDGKNDLTPCERELFKSSILRDYSNLLNEIDAYYNSNNNIMPPKKQIGESDYKVPTSDKDEKDK